MSYKALSVSALYDNIFFFYDVINSLLTFGLDCYWRKKTAQILIKKLQGKVKILDVCCGTGSFSIEIFNVYKGSAQVFGIDLNEKMLSVAKERYDNISFQLADAAKLPFENETFDAITISFATRNIAINEKYFLNTLKEFFRVLKKGGFLVSLETTKPKNVLIRFFMFSYVKLAIRILNLIKPDMKKAYTFLMNSIINFYSPSQLSDILKKSGFVDIEYTILCPGAVCVHIGKK